MYSDGHQQNHVGFGLNQRVTWYEKNKGRQVNLILHGGLSRGGVISGVDLEDGKVILNPYMGRDYSTGKELEVLVHCDERVVISSIIDERLLPEKHFEDYIRATRPTELSSVVSQSEFTRK